MIIDAFTHGFHGGYVEELSTAGGDWAKQTMTRFLARWKKDKPHAIDIGRRVEQLDRTGIDTQVVAPFHEMDSNQMPGDNTKTRLGYARVLNNAMARFMNESGGRLVAGGTLPLEGFEQGGREEMQRAVEELGLKAIVVVSNIRGKSLDLPEFEPFWAEAARLGIPVYIHPTNPIGSRDRNYEARYDLMHNFGWPFETELMICSLIFSGIIERYPTLKIVTHHLGGGIPFFWGRIQETYDPYFQLKHLGRVLNKPLSEYFSSFYFDTAVGGNGAAVRCAYEVFGAGPLVFATDAPFGPGSGERRMAEYPRMIRALGLPDKDTQKIFERNARTLLQL